VGDEETLQQARDRIFAAKQAERRRLAQLPFEEKILRVLRMQRVSRQFKQATRKR
jgi:hypothetical protein